MFNIEKLTWMNGVYIRDMPEERLSTQFVAEWLDDATCRRQSRAPSTAMLVARIVPLIRERIKLLSEAWSTATSSSSTSCRYAREDLLGKAFAIAGR